MLVTVWRFADFTNLYNINIEIEEWKKEYSEEPGSKLSMLQPKNMESTIQDLSCAWTDPT